jgi:hypothetical protein
MFVFCSERSMIISSHPLSLFSTHGTLQQIQILYAYCQCSAPRGDCVTCVALYVGQGALRRQVLAWPATERVAGGSPSPQQLQAQGAAVLVGPACLCGGPHAGEAALWTAIAHSVALRRSWKKWITYLHLIFSYHICHPFQFIHPHVFKTNERVKSARFLLHFFELNGSFICDLWVLQSSDLNDSEN